MPARVDEFVSWAEFRYQLRLWMRLSEEAAREQGISPQQHQLLLAVRGYPGPVPPLITDIAERLQLRHHSVVGLIDRMELDGLVEREEVGVGRGTSILLTDAGLDVLEAISDTLRPELRTAAQALIEALTTLVKPPRRARTPARHTTTRRRSSTAAR